MEDRFDRRFARRLGASVAAEVVGDVDVRVDPSGHHREAAQIVGGRAVAGTDRGDAAVLYGEPHVLEGFAGAVEHRVGVERHGACLRRHVGGRKDAGEDEECDLHRRRL
jgi:hypothetical protein